MDYRYDLLDKIKALSDEGKLDLAQYDGQTAKDLGTSEFEKIHYSVSSSLQMPAAAYKLELAGRDLGDKGTRLFENSLMLAVEYINGRLRFVDGDANGAADGKSASTVTEHGTLAAAPKIDEDSLKAIIDRLDTFETASRRMEGRLASVQKTLHDEVRKSSGAAANVADDGTSGELRIAIDMHDGETVLHDVAIILEKVTALQGTLEECAKGISANAEGSASCLSEIRSCSDSIDNLLNVLYFDDTDSVGDVDYDTIADDGDDTDMTSAMSDADDDGNDDAAGDADASSQADDTDDGTSASTEPNRSDTADNGDSAEDAPESIDNADDTDGKPAAGDGSDVLTAEPVMLSDDTHDDADGIADFGAGHIDSMDDIARKFAAQVSENLGIQPSDNNDTDDAVDDYDSDYADLFGETAEDLFDGGDDVMDASSSQAQDDEADTDAQSDMGEMDMSDFMSDVTFDSEDEAGTDTPKTLTREHCAGNDDGDADSDFGLDDDFPDMSDVFDDIAGDAGDNDAGTDAHVGSNDDSITVPARKRHDSKAKWKA